VKVLDDLIEGAAPKVVRIERGQPLVGELSAALKPAEPFKWLGAKLSSLGKVCVYKLFGVLGRGVLVVSTLRCNGRGAMVDRHPRALRLNLEPTYPDKVLPMVGEGWN